MAVIEKEIKLVGSKGEEQVAAIFDSGASYSCIQPELAGELELIVALPQPMEFGTGISRLSLRRAEAASRRRGRQRGSNLDITATQRVTLNFYVNGYRFSDEFMLIDSLSEPVLIGAATMQKWRLKLNFETDEVIIDPRVTKLRLLHLANT